MILDINIDGEDTFFEIKDIAPIALNDMLQRARYNKCIFLSIIVKNPQLSAHEWYSRVPEAIVDKFIERIIKYQEVPYA